MYVQHYGCTHIHTHIYVQLYTGIIWYNGGSSAGLNLQTIILVAGMHDQTGRSS